MKHLLPTAVSLFLILPAVALSETATGQDGPIRPDDAEGTALPSDGLAECAAILAVASSTSNNIVQRNNMQNASASWFAASGDLAIQEDALPETNVWETKVSSWAGRIGSVDAMAQHSDWMTYCGALGQQQGLDTRFFAAPAQ